MYKLTNYDLVIRISDGASIPFENDNEDYKKYLKWIDAGNVPIPADLPTQEELDAIQEQQERKTRVAQNKANTTIKYLVTHTDQEVEDFLLTKFPSLTNPEIKIIARLANAIGALYKGL